MSRTLNTAIDGQNRMSTGCSIPCRFAPLDPAALSPSVGPFFVAEYRPGDHVRLARNPHYWKQDSTGRQLPYLDSIRIDIQPNHGIELTRFLRVETQLVNKLNPQWRQSFRTMSAKLEFMSTS
jgi:ABC-type oligopeptide transport system substrate-binding subunit